MPPVLIRMAISVMGLIFSFSAIQENKAANSGAVAMITSVLATDVLWREKMKKIVEQVNNIVANIPPRPMRLNIAMGVKCLLVYAW